MATLTDVISRPASQYGLWSWITTVDHKRIGVLYGATAFISSCLAALRRASSACNWPSPITP